MATPAEQVAAAFSAATNYAESAKSSLTGFTNALNTSIYAPPTINVTWNAIAPPSLPDIPDAPTMPTIVFTAPDGEPLDLVLETPDIVIDDFVEPDPSLTIPTAPTVTYGTVPTVPAVEDVVVPTAPTLAVVDTPTFLSLNTISFGGIDLHEDFLANLESIPALTLVPPTPYSYARGPEYASALLNDLKATLASRLSGGTGLSNAVEQAIWDRARDRETKLALANEADISRAAEALGYELPSGVLTAQLREAQKNYYDKLSELSRDVAVKQAELEQENLRQTIDAGMRLEAQLIDYSYKLESLSFENAKAYAENALQIYNGAIDEYRALLGSYQVYATSYKTIIDAELAKVEVYRAQLQGEQAKADINRTLVEQYKAQVEAGLAQVEIYRAQVGAAQTLVQLEEAKISAAGEQIKAYVAQVNAETAKVEAYKASVQAEATKVEMFKTKADAFSAKVGAQAERAKAELARYNALVQAKASEWEAYRTKVQAESARIEALGKQSETLLDGFKANAAAVEAEARMHTQVWETQIKDYEASQQIALHTARANSEAVVATNNARLDAAKVGAQVYAQLTASAYSMINASASVGATSSMSVGWSYGGDVSGEAPVTTVV